MEFEKSLKVLVVEDNRINQKCAGLLLEKIRCSVEFANNGREGVVLASNNIFDIILMDIQMPEMNGLEAASRIREQNCTVPIVALTANVYNEDINDCLKAGMNDWLPKPYTQEDLYKVIRKWCSNR